MGAYIGLYAELCMGLHAWEQYIREYGDNTDGIPVVLRRVDSSGYLRMLPTLRMETPSTTDEKLYSFITLNGT